MTTLSRLTCCTACRNALNCRMSLLESDAWKLQQETSFNSGRSPLSAYSSNLTNPNLRSRMMAAKGI